ncbi:hypothetical protein EDF46_3236 [Frondihabitans sp. PhB188]|uniref:DUF6177 family protein n=1 Tax=Frondihabitans sp. PhB188 TaxID=2485200 RepID=UPI000FA19624|nr:DUF6177 family protein [Frondihabitans sp. PhB188]ROQ36693.1 hypothetical protein EDF46_3236 [Frondihabitans sp. PhB188]
MGRVGTPIRHPLIDAITPHAVRVASRSRVVRLTPPLADLLSRPPLADRTVVLVTPESARITIGLRSALVAAGGVWAVETPNGFRDGITGVDRADLDEAVLAPAKGNDPDADGDLPTGSLTSADAHTTQLSVDVTLLHRPTDDVMLGGALETMALAIGGGRPRAWGLAEPLEHGWDRWVLTQDARHRAPDASRFLVEGDGFSAAVTARFGGHGIEETVAITADVPGGSAGLDAAIERLGEALAILTVHSLPTFALVLARVGEADRTFRPVEYPPPNPVALLIGAPSVRRLALHERVFADDQDVVVVGSASRPAYLLPLGTATDPGWDRLHDALDSVGGDRLTALVAAPLLQAWEDDLHGDLDLHGEPHPHDRKPGDTGAGSRGGHPGAP